jgi:hypothetical protein
VASLPRFYEIFHELFHRGGSSSNCQKSGLAYFEQFVRRGVPNFRLGALKELPLEIRCAVESVTAGTPVYRCLACSGRIKIENQAHCSARCRGVCGCMVCKGIQPDGKACGVEVECEVCARQAGHGNKRPRKPVYTEQKIWSLASRQMGKVWRCNNCGFYLTRKMPPPSPEGPISGRPPWPVEWDGAIRKLNQDALDRRTFDEIVGRNRPSEFEGFAVMSVEQARESLRLMDAQEEEAFRRRADQIQREEKEEEDLRRWEEIAALPPGGSRRNRGGDGHM